MSLSGRSALNQNSGLAIASTVASAGVAPPRCSCGSSVSRLSKSFISGKHRQRAEDGAQNRQRLRIGRHHGARDFSERHEHRIARRVRLMLCGIEIVEAEREVQRVDVFERRGQEREMRDEKHRREAGGPEQFR